MIQSLAHNFPRGAFIDRISSDPEILHGKPCIKGTRIPVFLLVGLVAGGEPIDTILQDYPSVTKDDITAALRYAAKLAEYEVIGNIQKYH